jgi:hypothetical protein
MTANPNSVLDSVKKVLGFDPEFTAFDLDVTLLINSAFGQLNQLGVGGDTGFVISDNTTLWSQYISELQYLNMAKQYIFLWVRLSFDPPSTSFGIEAIQKLIQELAWRICSVVEHISPPSEPGAEEDAPTSDTTVTWYKVKVADLTYASTVSPDAGEANTFYLELTGDCTINPPVNGADGQHITLEITSNGYSVFWPNGWNFGDPGTPPLSDGGKTDIISAVYRQSVADWYTGFTPGF